MLSFNFSRIFYRLDDYSCFLCLTKLLTCLIGYLVFMHCASPIFISQVENLTRKAQLQEVELERTTQQLKEAVAIAEEETAKCKAAKEVIKSLTAQVRWIYVCLWSMDIYFNKTLALYLCIAMSLRNHNLELYFSPI